MGVDFLGLRFERLGIEHRDRISAILTRHPQPLSDYCFSSLFAWALRFDTRFAIVAPDTLLLTANQEETPTPALLQPVGAFPAPLQDDLLRRARELASPLRIESVSRAFLDRHQGFAARFEVAEVRASANYVYAAADLAELPGRRYAGKRNLIAQASRLTPWSVEPLDPARLSACLEVRDDIAAGRSAEGGLTHEQETAALRRALDHFAALGLGGLLVRVGGAPAAFSVFDRLSPDTAVVLFERARRDLKGIYQVVSREAARMLVARSYAFVNREEDLGDPGLRKAKLSYHPDRLEMKHTLTLRG
ncbi:MAG TPA: phosphatidylglycerol lysyltransferase domain-containing protein [Thermoanaerobaculaceae bacterium]|nr:phosphatidylglycerol lysyltransferase domain-containing protein [Thermoanaerobaculaceae bacterium]